MLGDFPIKKKEKGELVETFGKHPSPLHSTRGAYHLAKKFHYFGGMLIVNVIFWKFQPNVEDYICGKRLSLRLVKLKGILFTIFHLFGFRITLHKLEPFSDSICN